MPRNKHDSGYEGGGIAFVGSIFIGIGLGIKYGQVATGTLVGIGIGFILMALFKAVKK